MNYFVYALYNAEGNKIYIGQTSDIDRRLKEHNLKVGKHYTAQARGEWKVIYKEYLESKTEALKREKQLKSCQGRLFIKKLIANPL
ncbi:GIY-YIG nuclease family protein [Patescibacteria group bacterium]|nr:GIY-YIG nuclease family protein [Patescibacteria group bacterium]